MSLRSPPSFDSPERSSYRRGNTPLHSLSLISLRSGATVCPPAPSLDAREIQPCLWRFSTAYRSRSFLPSPLPILQAAPHKVEGGPSPRLPARLAPRFRSLRVARRRACSALGASGAPAPIRIKPILPLRGITSFAGLAPARMAASPPLSFTRVFKQGHRCPAAPKSLNPVKSSESRTLFQLVTIRDNGTCRQLPNKLRLSRRSVNSHSLCLSV